MYDAKTNPRGRRPAAFFLAILLALSLSLAPAWAAEGEKQVIPLGRAVGIKLFSSGVLVVDLSAVTGESGEKSPAKSCGLKEGDVIVSAAGSELRSTEQLQELLQQAISCFQFPKRNIYSYFCQISKTFHCAKFRILIWCLFHPV